MLSRFINFLFREQASLNFMAAVTVHSDSGAQENKVCHCFYFVAGVQLPSRVRLFATPQTAAGQASLSFTISWSLVKLMFIESVMLSSHLILWCPLLLLPSIFSSIRDFSSELVVHIRWPKHRSFSFSISPSNEFSGLISFRVVCFDLLAVQGTLKSLLQDYSSKALILRCSAFFTVQLLHPYMTTGKTIALTRRTFVGKLMSLLFNMLSSLVITFLSRSKHLLISWLHLCWQSNVSAFQYALKFGYNFSFKE